MSTCKYSYSPPRLGLDAAQVMSRQREKLEGIVQCKPLMILKCVLAFCILLALRVQNVVWSPGLRRPWHM
eukprot:1166213-Karenia_brevis.AAC.1